MKERRLVILGTMLFTACSLIFYILPAYLAFVSARLHLTPAEFGTLASVEHMALAMTSLLSPLWVDRFARKPWLLVAALLVCVVGNIAAAFSGSFAVLLTIRTLVGFFGEGIVCVICFVVLGATLNADRSFSIALASVVAVGALIVASASTISAAFPTFGPLAAVIAVALLALPFAPWLTTANSSTATENIQTDAAESASIEDGVIVALLAQCVWSAGPGAFWAFAERIATAQGVSTGRIEIALSIGLVGSLVGALVPAWQGRRWGQIVPLSIGTVAMVIAGGAYYLLSDNSLALPASIAAFYALWNYCSVYQMSFVTGLDQSGRFMAVIPSMQVFGFALGPLCTGFLVERIGIPGAPLALLLFTAAGMGLYLIALARRRSAQARLEFNVA
jgi:predicted MFS family arabinose efflux permease